MCMVMGIGGWSVGRAVEVDQEILGASFGEQSVRSGEVGSWLVLYGCLVGWSGSFRIKVH